MDDNNFPGFKNEKVGIPYSMRTESQNTLEKPEQKLSTIYKKMMIKEQYIKRKKRFN